MRALQDASRVTLMVAVLLAPAAAQGHMDREFGYRISPPNKWEAVPPQPRETHLKMKWTSPRPERDLPAEMHVYVFERTKEEETASDGDGAESVEAALRAFRRRQQVRSYSEFINSDYRRKGMKLGKGKKFRVKGPKDRPIESALRYKTSRPSNMVRGATKMADYVVYVGVIVTPRFEYAIECFASEKADRKLGPAFKSAIRSFRLLDAPVQSRTTGDTDERPAADGYKRTGMTAKEEARKRARDEVARTPGWWYLETDRYMIVTNCEKKRKGFIQEIGRRLEAIRDRYEVDFPAAKPITEVSIVRVCKDRSTYMNYGAPGGSAGYWSASARELVFYRKGGEKTPFQVLNHEAFHQYIYYSCGSLSPHSWYNEGLGDYYAGARFQGKRITRIAPFLWRRDTIRSAVRDGSYVPIKDIIRYSQRQYYSNSRLCYAQGWSMIYFLQKGISEDHPWRRIIPTYLKTLQATQERDKAVDAAFEGVDLDRFESAWKAFTVKGKVLTR